MKKAIYAILAFAFILSVTACANTQLFNSENAMMERVSGMWVLDDLQEDKTYYVFQDSKIYILNDTQFSYKIEKLFDAFVEEGRLAELCQLDFAGAMDSLTTETILGNAQNNVTLQPQKGKIIIDQGESFEKSILITEESVSVKEVDDQYGIDLIKISDTVDYTGEHFKEIFEEVKANYTIPTAQFWTDTKEYGAMVKAFNPEIDGWVLTTQNETTTIYESSKWVPSITGALIITDKDVTFTRKVSLQGGWNPSFTVLYSPENRSVQIFDLDNMSLDMGLLLQYGANAVRGVPGAIEYTQVMEIIAEEFAQGRYSIEDGAAVAEKTINGITYKVRQGMNSMWGMVTVSTNETIKLEDVINYMQESESKPTTPPEPENTEPPTAETQPPAVCSHNYAKATCTKPQTCTKCGATTGSAAGHSWKNATCTTPQTCITCGATAGSAAGHQWKKATCIYPETCSVCNQTQGDALGHSMGLTKCRNCDYTDYSAIAKAYPNITAYDSKTGADLEVTDVSVSSSGVLEFCFNGKSYSITLSERYYDSMTYFDCYYNGSLLNDATCRVGDASYYNMLHFEWRGVDGHRLYFNTGKQ